MPKFWATRRVRAWTFVRPLAHQAVGEVFAGAERTGDPPLVFQIDEGEEDLLFSGELAVGAGPFKGDFGVATGFEDLNVEELIFPSGIGVEALLEEEESAEVAIFGFDGFAKGREEPIGDVAVIALVDLAETVVDLFPESVFRVAARGEDKQADEGKKKNGGSGQHGAFP